VQPSWDKSEVTDSIAITEPRAVGQFTLGLQCLWVLVKKMTFLRMPSSGILRRVALVRTDGILHGHRRENLKSYDVIFGFIKEEH
jgi:hypothetical protein